MPLGKIKNNGNFMVSIHRVSVNVFLIISDVCLISRFKRGVVPLI